jgi:hypothetical protein
MLLRCGKPDMHLFPRRSRPNAAGKFFVENAAHAAAALSGRARVARPLAASSSIFSSARTGTRNSLPILMVGISPRAAASYAALRHNPK